MKPIKTNTTNVNLVRDDCGDLPATQFVDPEYGPCFESCFELSDEDIEILIKTRRIYLGVISSTHPPISLTLESLVKGRE